MIDRKQLSHFPEQEYKLKQFSSYDRLSVDPDQEGWYANADYTQFIRQEDNDGRREFVLFDDEGAGALVRWWMTFAGEGSYEGILRIYIDNEPVPVIEDEVLKVVSGQLLAGEPLSSSVSPESDYYRRGHNLYLPVPYQNRCKITYECDAVKEVDGRMRPSIYYNINYREYTGQAKVESFSLASLEKNITLINKVNKELLENNESSTQADKISNSIAPDDTLVFEIDKSNSAIAYLRLKIDAENHRQALRSAVLSIAFDGTESVWVPVGDFFGTGFTLCESDTWYSKVTSDGNMHSSWLMPFKDKAIIRIINFGNESIECELQASVTDYRWSGSSMYFAALWHEYNRVQSAGAPGVGGSGKHFDINYVDIDGKGVYLGDAVTVFNTVDAWWGEGDEKIFVDGEKFPSSIGTGTEDYYGYAWCRPEVFTHPFIAQPSGKGNFHPGMSVNSRYRILDAIPFNNKISSNIELWHWAPTVMNYALTSYFYALPGYKVNIEPDAALVKLEVPSERSDLIEPIVNDDGIIEAENMKIEALRELSAERQFIASWDWSGNGQLWIKDGKPGSGLTASFISPEAGRYKITGRFSLASDYGISEYYINDKKACRINAYTPGEKVIEKYLGIFEIAEGHNTFRIELLGTDPAAKTKYMAGVDMLKLSRVY